MVILHAADFCAKVWIHLSAELGFTILLSRKLISHCSGLLLDHAEQYWKWKRCCQVRSIIWLGSPIINNRSVWYSWHTGFMVGWHIQQLVKLEMAFRVEEQGLLYCDSDVFFMRPFDIGNLITGGLFRFYRSEKIFEEGVISYPKYSSVSARQLGLAGKPFPCSTYVENLVPWHRPTVKALCNHLAETSGRDWKLVLGRDIIISEYTLYGLFVDRVMKDRSHLKTSHDVLCKTVWNRRAIDDAALDAFCSDLADPVVAVGVQSFAGIAVERLEQQLKKALARV